MIHSDNDDKYIKQYKNIIITESNIDKFDKIVAPLFEHYELKTPITIIPKIYNLRINFLLKAIGLFLSDGYFSKVLKYNKTRILNFRGVTKDTAYAIVKTNLPISEKIYVKNMINRFNMAIYLDVKVVVKTELLLLYVRSLLDNTMRRKFLNSLDDHHLMWLFSGLIDGDGFIGSKYMSISFKRETIKGKIIEEILKILSERGIITLGSYYGKPRYEQVFSIPLPYARIFSNMLFIQYKREKMINRVRNKISQELCKLTGYEDVLARNLRSCYIDYRRNVRRSPILVMYLNLNNETLKIPGVIVRADKRAMIKIPVKCNSLLINLLKYNLINNPKDRNIINKFIELTKE